MTLEEAYSLIGLVPLDQYMRGAWKENIARSPNRKPISALTPRSVPAEWSRQLGATTWMCVRAALALEESSVLIVGCFGQNQVMDMVRRTARWAERLHRTEVSHDWTREPQGRWGGDKRYEMSNGASLRWTVTSPGTKVVGTAGHRGLVFSDWEWAERMVRRVLGPFAMIREIRCVQDYNGGECFRAYAEEEEYLLELPLEGAEALLAQNPDIRCRGWRPSSSGPLSPF